MDKDFPLSVVQCIVDWAMLVDMLVSDYSGKSRLTLLIQMNHIDWVTQVDLLGPDYTSDTRLTLVVLADPLLYLWTKTIL